MRYEKGTFVTLPNVREMRGLKPHIQSVYIWINQYANEKGVCFPSRRTLADSAGVCLRTLDAALQVLVTRGLISKIRRADPDDPKNALTNVYQVMVIQDEGGSAGDALGGGAGDALPLVQEMPRELNPVLTKKGENEFSLSSEEIVEVADDERPRMKKDQSVLKLRQKLYDMFTRTKGVAPLPHLGDYVIVQTALKHLKPDQIEEMVEYQLAYENPVTVRECLTNRRITKFLQENY